MKGTQARIRHLAQMVEKEWGGEYSITHVKGGHLEIVIRNGDRTKKLQTATSSRNYRTELNTRTRIRRAVEEVTCRK